MPKAQFQTVTCEFSSLEESDFAISKMRNAHLPIMDINISRSHFSKNIDRPDPFIVPTFSYNLTGWLCQQFQLWGAPADFPLWHGLCHSGGTARQCR